MKIARIETFLFDPGTGNRGTTTGTQVAGSPNAGGQTGDGNNRACANQAGRRRALT